MDRKRVVSVEGAAMAYHEVGEGRPIVLLHGNPTSSYLWRNVVPRISDRGRCIVPDLVGMGDSEKIGGEYRFVDHRRHLDALLERLGATDDAVIVGHDWGGALLFDWANRHREAVSGVAYMETIVMPVTWDMWPEASRGIFQAMRSPAGEGLILERNFFVDRILPASVLEPLSEDTMAEYRRPFLEEGESRRPTLTWPREIPIDGEPSEMVEIVDAYGSWLASSPVPKLFINADPGSILVGAQREFCRTWPNQTEVTVPGIHFIQEDSPGLIGDAISDWLSTI